MILDEKAAEHLLFNLEVIEHRLRHAGRIDLSHTFMCTTAVLLTRAVPWVYFGPGPRFWARLHRQLVMSIIRGGAPPDTSLVIAARKAVERGLAEHREAPRKGFVFQLVEP